MPAAPAARRPRRRRQLRTAVLLLGVVGLLSGGATSPLLSHDASLAAVPVPVSGSERVLADTLVVDELTYVGLHSVGSVDVLRFTAVSGRATGFQLASACQGGHTVVQTATGQVTLGSSTLDLYALAATVGGAAVSFTPSSPPTASFPSPVELDQVDADVSSLVSAEVTMSGATLTIAAC